MKIFKPFNIIPIFSIIKRLFTNCFSYIIYDKTQQVRIRSPRASCLRARDDTVIICKGIRGGTTKRSNLFFYVRSRENSLKFVHV